MRQFKPLLLESTQSRITQIWQACRILIRTLDRFLKNWLLRTATRSSSWCVPLFHEGLVIVTRRYFTSITCFIGRSSTASLHVSDCLEIIIHLFFSVDTFVLKYVCDLQNRRRGIIYHLCSAIKTYNKLYLYYVSTRRYPLFIRYLLCLSLPS